jgi:hypothetical protein
VSYEATGALPLPRGSKISENTVLGQKSPLLEGQQVGNGGHRALHVKEIRKLARQFSPEELDLCFDQQLKEGKNICELTGPTEEVIKILSEAKFVKDLMDNGVSLSDAVRELAKRIRSVQEGFAIVD